MKALRQFLRPEFLGRVDEVVVFKPLSGETLEKIAALMLEEYRPGMEAKGIAYSYTPRATCAGSSARRWRTRPPPASSTASSPPAAA